MIYFIKHLILLVLIVVIALVVWSQYRQRPLLQTKVDKILVEKAKRQMTVFVQGKALKTYNVSLGFQPQGKKQQEGDGRTPEGRYVIDYKNPKSGYHLSLHISYPDTHDLNHAKALGVSAGGNVMIHGMKNGYGYIGNLHRFKDWTAGCIAVTDWEMDELWQAIDEGTVIEIIP